MKPSNRLKFIFRLNLAVFACFVLILILGASFKTSLFSYARIAFGVAIFFITGVDIVLPFEKISKVALDIWEFTTLGLFFALFLTPLIVYVFFVISGFVSEVSVISIYAVLSATSLIAGYFLERNEFRKN